MIKAILEPTIFKTFEDAKEAYYVDHIARSDDGDSEEGNIMNWVDSEGHSIIDGNI